MKLISMLHVPDPLQMPCPPIYYHHKFIILTDLYFSLTDYELVEPVQTQISESRHCSQIPFL